MVDEAHITTFAVHPAWRRRRIGERLLLALLDHSVDRGAREATLEVRLSNPLRGGSTKYGLRPPPAAALHTDGNETPRS
jgi:ribosomal-protein-alanine N-acetyltransferase